MNRVGSWRRYLFCPCGKVVSPQCSYEVCPDCGSSMLNFTEAIARCVDDSVWWKPSTWDREHYEKLVHGGP